MKSNLEHLKKHAKETALKSRYERVQRTGKLSPDNPLPAAANIDRTIIAPAGAEYLCVEESPLPRWELVDDYEIHQLFERPNGLLLFRVLESFFGEADLLGAAFTEYEPEKLTVLPLTTDWGFAFHLAPDLVSEVRSLNGGRQNVVRLWASSTAQATVDPTGTKDAFLRFVSDLKAAFAGNQHLFAEEQELEATRPDLQPAILNVSREKYEAAVRLLEAAGVLEDANRTPELREALAQEGKTEALLLGAVTLFLISLEAFINMLYSLLLRADFDHERYERFLTRSDLDVRVLSLHVFCRGFTRQPILPGSDLWKELMRLREFRNDLVHGNVTEEHRMHTLSEGIYMFCYQPFRDYRGPKPQKRMGDRISRYTAEIDDEFVRRVRGIVDRVKEAVVDALDPDLSRWGRELFEEDVLMSPAASQQVGEPVSSA